MKFICAVQRLIIDEKGSGFRDIYNLLKLKQVKKGAEGWHKWIINWQNNEQWGPMK